MDIKTYKIFLYICFEINRSSIKSMKGVHTLLSCGVYDVLVLVAAARCGLAGADCRGLRVWPGSPAAATAELWPAAPPPAPPPPATPPPAPAEEFAPFIVVVTPKQISLVTVCRVKHSRPRALGRDQFVLHASSLVRQKIDPSLRCRQRRFLNNSYNLSWTVLCCPGAAELRPLLVKTSYLQNPAREWWAGRTGAAGRDAVLRERGEQTEARLAGTGWV